MKSANPNHLRINFVHQKLLNMENLRSIQDSRRPLSDTRLMKHLFIFIFICSFFFILRRNLLLLHNSLIIYLIESGFDIKTLALFIDCLNFRKQETNVVSSCNV